MNIFITIFINLFFITNSFAAPSIVYGDDDRKEFYESSKRYQKWARASAAMFGKFQLVDHDDHFTIFANNLEGHGVCSTQRFAKQPAGASCSGFLVDKDLIVTAGHCVTEQYDCENYYWVFDYQINSPNEKFEKIYKKNVYECLEIVERKFNFFTKNDYAVIRLKRAVKNRTPLEYRTSKKAPAGTPLVMIGYPSGLPLKIADNAIIRKNHWKYFRANLDAFTMNSGSAVINANTGIVEGILVGGGDDYNEVNGCKEVNVEDQDGGRGEDVSYITNIKYLKYLLREK